MEYGEREPKRGCKGPPFPPSVAARERIAARTSHFALYACMLIMPLAGYRASNFSKVVFRRMWPARSP